MKSFRIPVQKGTGIAAANGIRQEALGLMPSWRPIGFSLNRDMTYVQASGDVLTKPVRFTMDLIDCVFKPIGDFGGKDYWIDTIVFEKDLYPHMLSSQHFEVTGREDKPLLSTLESSCELQIVYRLAPGLIRAPENLTFMEEIGLEAPPFMGMNSRHSNVTRFTFDVVNSSESEEILVLKLEADTGNEEQVLLEAVSAYRNRISNIYSSLVDSLEISTVS